MKNFFRNDKTYKNNLNQYDIKDGLLALCLFGIFIFMYSILAVVDMKVKYIKDNFVIVGCILNCLLVLITILFVKLRKQSLDTIGLYNGKWKKSFCIGTLFAGILFFNNCGSYLLQGKELININRIFTYVIEFFFVALCEEVVFRGYISTRIYGIMKRQWLSIVVTGLLFVIMHFPYRMIVSGMSLKEFTANNIFWFIDLFVTHTILNFIYAKTNSLYGAIIPHWVSNLAFNIVIK
ncbi:hypothetical protein SAMN02745163_01380 [Clostridium cavendishii DSM 21758]|uniref:CAAX prenyl protease 2/Lysostaphin resistance protein A-like domain-containing protein n=1 Tax=Clostridium cavendishii DSM 21758 TaxID=1121302 RepID=A0A1M6GTH3_9CLOT|nr:type II CAAX endopeptidase family protein [Clostridium cavendishii]SHJ13169.1 hypothetical protein SAMN02745163_01380 [Clostridium cavendishii DSM 21758]